MSKSISRQTVFLDNEGKIVKVTDLSQLDTEKIAVLLKATGFDVAEKWSQLVETGITSVMHLRGHSRLDNTEDVISIFLNEIRPAFDQYYTTQALFSSTTPDYAQIESATAAMLSVCSKYLPGLSTDITKGLVHKFVEDIRKHLDDIVFVCQKLAFLSHLIPDDAKEERQNEFYSMSNICWSDFIHEIEEHSRIGLPGKIKINVQKERHEFNRLLQEGMDVMTACNAAAVNVRERGSIPAFKRWFKAVFGIDNIVE